MEANNMAEISNVMYTCVFFCLHFSFFRKSMECVCGLKFVYMSAYKMHVQSHKCLQGVGMQATSALLTEGPGAKETEEPSMAYAHVDTATFADRDDDGHVETRTLTDGHADSEVDGEARQDDGDFDGARHDDGDFDGVARRLDDGAVDRELFTRPEETEQVGAHSSVSQSETLFCPFM